MSALELSYMPGCTLKTKAKNFETTTLKLLELLDVRAEELPDWYCCGTTYSLASDNLMNHLGPIRTLVKAKESGRGALLVLCSMCYNTLRRAQELVRSDAEKRDKSQREQQLPLAVVIYQRRVHDKGTQRHHKAKQAPGGGYSGSHQLGGSNNQ